jgi:hypothetical protein
MRSSLEGSRGEGRAGRWCGCRGANALRSPAPPRLRPGVESDDRGSAPIRLRRRGGRPGPTRNLAPAPNPKNTSPVQRHLRLDIDLADQDERRRGKAGRGQWPSGAPVPQPQATGPVSCAFQPPEPLRPWTDPIGSTKLSGPARGNEDASGLYGPEGPRAAHSAV